MAFDPRNIVESTRIIADLGYKHVELCCASPGFDYRNVTVDTVRDLVELADRYELHYTVHPHVVNTAAADEEERRSALADYIGAARLAERVGATAIVVHAGFKSYPESSREQAIDNALNVIHEIDEVAASLGIGMLLENTGWREHAVLRTPADLLDMRAQCPAGTRILLDTGHAVLQGFDVADCARLWMPYLEEIHAHDNSGDDDEHLPIGQGVIDWSALMHVLSGEAWQGLFTIEIERGSDTQGDIASCEAHIRKALARSL